MKRILVLALYCALGLSSLIAQDFSRYVDPRIGSEGLGRTFPGPCMPYGMAKPGPDAVSMPNAGWAPMPEPIKGFSQIHSAERGWTEVWQYPDSAFLGCWGNHPETCG